MYTAKISFSPFGLPGLPPVAGNSSSPGVSHGGAEVKLVYELATKVGVFMFSLSLDLTHGTVCIGPITQPCISIYKIEHDIREHR